MKASSLALLFSIKLHILDITLSNKSSKHYCNDKLKWMESFPKIGKVYLPQFILT